jgi:CRP-like cAMP-binding protein
MLAALTPTVYARLTPNLKRVRLEAGSALFDIGSTSDHAWFITSGIVSLLTTTKDGDVIEAATIGREGVVGLSGIEKRNGMAFSARRGFQARRCRATRELCKVCLSGKARFINCSLNIHIL